MLNVCSEQISYSSKAAVTAEKQQTELYICQTEAMQNDTWDSQEKYFHIKTNLLAPNNSSSVPPTQHRSSYFSSAVATLLDRWSLLG